MKKANILNRFTIQRVEGRTGNFHLGRVILSIHFFTCVLNTLVVGGDISLVDLFRDVHFGLGIPGVCFLFLGPNLKMHLEQRFQSTYLNAVSLIVSVDKNATALNAFSTALAWVSLIFKSLETEEQSERVKDEEPL